MVAQKECLHVARKRHGFTRTGEQRFRCKDCGQAFTAKTEVLGGMRIDLDLAERVVKCLMEGVSINATCRLTGISKPTVLDLIVSLGKKCEAFTDKCVRNVPVREVQCDEIWSFTYCKDRTRRENNWEEGDVGDQWCFTAIERRTKLILSWQSGQRDIATARVFMAKLSKATLKAPFQITTDGWAPYRGLIPGWLNRHHVSFAVVVKNYGNTEDTGRYSPGRIISTEKRAIRGNPDMRRASTSHVERQNLTIRMGMRRFTRLTNGFSKKRANHEAALALFFTHYNFCRRHSTLKTTPACAAFIADKPWTVRELLEKLAAY